MPRSVTIKSTCNRRAGASSAPPTEGGDSMHTDHVHHAPRGHAHGCCCLDSRAMDHMPDLATDPVCGMKIVPGAAGVGSLVHSGETFHFCSSRCQEKFSADPVRYSKPSGLAAGQTQRSDATPTTYYV